MLLPLSCVGPEVSGAGRKRSRMSRGKQKHIEIQLEFKPVSVCHCLPLNDTDDLQKLLILFATELFMYWAPKLGEGSRRDTVERGRAEGLAVSQANKASR